MAGAQRGQSRTLALGPGFGLGLAAAVALLAGARPAAAQASTGIAADRLAPALGPTALGQTEGAAVTPALHVSWAVSLGYLRDPLTLRTAYTGALLSRPVSGQLVSDIGLEFGIWRRLAIAVAVPVVLYQTGDRLRGTGVDDRPLASTVAGDLRIRLKAQLVGDARRPGFHFAALLQVTAPTGGQHDFAATDGATVEPRLLFDWSGGRWLLAINVGGRFQKDRQLFFTQFGDELTVSGGAAVRVAQRGRFSSSLWLEAAAAVGANAGSRPAELRGAVRLGWAALAFDLGAGGGVDGDAAAPRWRVFALARGVAPSL